MLKRMSVAFLVMLAFAGPASAAVITKSLSDFVIFGNGDTTIGGHTFITGNIGSNQDLFQQGNPLTGYPAQLSGSAYAGGKLTFGQDLTVGTSSLSQQVVANGAADIGSGVTIWGTLDALSTSLGLSPAPMITGGVTAPSGTTFGLITMPTAPSFTATGPNQLVPNTPGTCTTRGCEGFLALAPGPSNTYGSLETDAQYQTVRLNNNGTTGDYYFSSIMALGTFTLEIDLTNGPVNINVAGDADFGAADPMLMVKDASTGGLFVPISQRPDLAGLINWNILGQFRLGGGDKNESNPIYTSVWGGTLYSSFFGNGGIGEGNGVYFEQAVDWYGALYAFDSIRLLDHSRITYEPTINGTVPEPGTLGLLGLGLVGFGFMRRKQ